MNRLFHARFKLDSRVRLELSAKAERVSQDKRTGMRHDTLPCLVSPITMRPSNRLEGGCYTTGIDLPLRRLNFWENKHLLKEYLPLTKYTDQRF